MTFLLKSASRGKLKTSITDLILIKSNLISSKSNRLMAHPLYIMIFRMEVLNQLQGEMWKIKEGRSNASMV